MFDFGLLHRLGRLRLGDGRRLLALGDDGSAGGFVLDLLFGDPRKVHRGLQLLGRGRRRRLGFFRLLLLFGRRRLLGGLFLRLLLRLFFGFFFWLVFGFLLRRLGRLFLDQLHRNDLWLDRRLGQIVFAQQGHHHQTNVHKKTESDKHRETLDGGAGPHLWRDQTIRAESFQGRQHHSTLRCC